jgi:hypothetical protein
MLGTAPMKTGTAAKNRVTPIIAQVGSLLPPTHGSYRPSRQRSP